MNPNISQSATGGAPFQDALGLLAADHQTVSDLFEEYQAALEAESDEQQDIADEICMQLEIHTELEEEVFYPTLAKEAALKALVDEALKEHDEVKTTVQRLRALGAADAEFGSLMMQLMEDVEHHVEEEENVMFPEIERHLEAAALTQLATRLQERRQELMEAHGAAD